MRGNLLLSAIAGSLVLAGTLAACGGGEEAAPEGQPAGGAAPAASQPTSPAPTEAAVSILHVEEGCHIWSDGERQAAAMKLELGPGGVLTVRNEDIDAHKLVQLAGPGVRLGGVMMMSGQTAVAFPEPGVYRLRTETVEMPGEEMMEVETESPDNELELEIEVR